MIEINAATQVFTGTLVIAVIFGMSAARSHFCVMGAVADWVSMGDRCRLRSWLLAIATAMLGLTLLQWAGLVDTHDMRIDYRNTQFAWARYVLGGLLFGIGMTLASGCSSKNLVRLGGGNLKSLIVLFAVGLLAVAMTRGELYALLFHGWMRHLNVNLNAWGLTSQGLDTLISRLLDSNPVRTRIGFGVAAAAGLIIFVFRSEDFRASSRLISGGLLIGLTVAAGWWLTGSPVGQRWIEDALFQDTPPRGVGVQSLTFVSGAADALRWLAAPLDHSLITFAVIAAGGVFLGSFVYTLLFDRLRLEWFTSWADFARHVCGGALMGIGGVLALGCSIGQGITGISTLALGSIVAAASMVLGSALTMKVQLYLMVYQNDAGVLSALLSALADLRLLPKRVRRHEPL